MLKHLLVFKTKVLNLCSRGLGIIPAAAGGAEQGCCEQEKWAAHLEVANTRKPVWILGIQLGKSSFHTKMVHLLQPDSSSRSVKSQADF